MLYSLSLLLLPAANKKMLAICLQCTHMPHNELDDMLYSPSPKQNQDTQVSVVHLQMLQVGEMARIEGFRLAKPDSEQSASDAELVVVSCAIVFPSGGCLVTCRAGWQGSLPLPWSAPNILCIWSAASCMATAATLTDTWRHA